jgi:hypothetical protein
MRVLNCCNLKERVYLFSTMPVRIHSNHGKFSLHRIVQKTDQFFSNDSKRHSCCIKLCCHPDKFGLCRPEQPVRFILRIEPLSDFKHGEEIELHCANRENICRRLITNLAVERLPVATRVQKHEFAGG